jgi:hypothetical protein
MGWFDQATGGWRPSWRWGAPVNVAGAQELSSQPASSATAVPRFLSNDIVLDCRDNDGTRFQFLVMGEDVSAVRLGMTQAPQSDTVGLRQRLQTMVSPSTISCLLIGFGLIGVATDAAGAAAWVLGCAVAFWIIGAMVIVRQYWYRRHLACTDWAAPRVEPVTPSETPTHTAVEDLPRRKPDLRG